MKKMMFFILGGLLLSSSLVSFSNADVNQREDTLQLVSQSFDGYIDISPQQAWGMMSDSSDGRQIPVDVRRPEEYLNERIVTPNQEDWPRWFPYEIESGGYGPIKNQGIFLQLFMDYYEDKEIILYCRTGRRTAISAQILVDNGFQGTVYNMLGGITDWKASGLPTTLN